MPVLTVHQGFQKTEWTAEAGTPISRILAENGILVPQPCGGRGVCGKCAALMEGGLSAPTPEERKAGTRLICQAVLLGDASITIPQTQPMDQIETGGVEVMPEQPLGTGVGAAVDIGTTTLALRLFDLQTGQCLGVSSMANPQIAVAADVIGRIGAAMDGRLEHLRSMIVSAIETLIAQSAAQAGFEPAKVQTLAATGNTTMLYLLTGRNPEPLSHSPFEADCLFDETVQLGSRKAWLPPCLHAFVGADITCAVLASGMMKKDDIALLCDVGTNGEIALWKDGVLYVASTAAGPAFEGAGITCGCGSIPGAIDRVAVKDGALEVSTIRHQPAVGLCGSGLVDAVAAMLELEWVDETGAMDDDEVTLRDSVVLTQADIRAVQLAKAAIAAGIECLLRTAGVKHEQVQKVYLAGGFGSHLNLNNAARIGLLPESLIPRTEVIGNAALNGTVMTLLRGENLQELRRIAACAKHVDLGGNPVFNEQYVEMMFFPEV
ncbi:MAG: DUF4445 domain-containing protein [Clostridia bacterium]|nr:DUF4445 domain-containing protein [Clostridia bacterium]